MTTTSLDRWSWMVAELNGKIVFGMPGVRDPDHPCEAFDPGEPSLGGGCEGDSHYMCLECKHMIVCGGCRERRENCTCYDRDHAAKGGWLKVWTVEPAEEST